MSTTTIIILVVVVGLVAALAARGAGPRVTQIDRTVRREKERGE